MRKLILTLSIASLVIIAGLAITQLKTSSVFATTSKSTSASKSSSASKPASKTISTIKINNKIISLKDKPYLKNNLTYLPTSLVSSIGGKVSFKSGKQVLTYKNLSATVNTGNIYATAGKVKVYLGGPVECNKSGKLFIPSALFTKVFLSKIKLSGSSIYITTTKLKKLPIPPASLKPTPKPTAQPQSFVCSVKVNGKLITFGKNKPAMVQGMESLPALDILKALGLKADYKPGSLTTTTIDGKSVTLSESTGMFDYNGTAYMPYQAFQQLLTTADWFDENKMVVINAYVKRKVWTHTNCGSGNLIEQRTLWQQMNIFDRLIQSDNYLLKKFPNYDYKGEGKVYIPKDKKALYYLFDPDTCEKYNYQYIKGIDQKKLLQINQNDLLINVEENGFGEYTRHKIREILKIGLPNSYLDAYSQMMKVLREELWESQDNNSNSPCLEGWFTDNRTTNFRLVDYLTVNRMVIQISPYGTQVDDISDPYYNVNGRWQLKVVKSGWDKIIAKYGLDKE